MFRDIIFLLYFLCVFQLVDSQSNVRFSPSKADARHLQWADSVYQSMTEDERIAQLFWISVEVIQDEKRFQTSLKLVETYQPGGILYMKNPAASIVNFTNLAQSKSKVPMLIAIDGENGLAMRVDGVLPFPKAMTLGATTDTAIAYQMGQLVARQFKQIGIHVNFAPVADVNSNPKNPIIGVRSYGENPQMAARLSGYYMLGMQDGGLMTVAKHFPGHGDTNSDSHKVLPLVNHSKAMLDSVDLIPFRALINHGIMGVMTAHLEVPSLEPQTAVPASISRKIVTNLLKTELGFDGLVITDAMNMKGVKKSGLPGRVDALALIAGNDIIESTENLGLAIAEVKKALANGELSWSDIEQKCKKQLVVKSILNVSERQEVVVNQLNIKGDSLLVQQIYDKALTVVRSASDNRQRPLSDSIAFIVMSNQKQWRDSLDKHCHATFFQVKPQMVVADIDKLIRQIEKFKSVVILADNSVSTRNLWADAGFKRLYDKLSSLDKTWLVFGGTPYLLNRFAGVQKAKNVMVTYEENSFICSSVARFFSGKIGAGGALPVTALPLGVVGQGVKIE
jgi:beta-glucosidase-like glycosyl hydrolase